MMLKLNFIKKQPSANATCTEFDQVVVKAEMEPNGWTCS